MGNENEYDLGQAVELTNVDNPFKLPNGTPTDPTTVTIKVRDPEGIVTTPAPVHGTAGVYSAVITLNKEGRWYYRFEGTGAVQASDERSLIVKDSAFYAP